MGISIEERVHRRIKNGSEPESINVLLLAAEDALKRIGTLEYRMKNMREIMRKIMARVSENTEDIYKLGYDRELRNIKKGR